MLGMCWQTRCRHVPSSWYEQSFQDWPVIHKYVHQSNLAGPVEINSSNCYWQSHDTLLELQQTVFICAVSDSTGPNAELLLSCNKKIEIPVHTMEACKGRRGIAPLLLTLSTRWRVINFIPCPLYPSKHWREGWVDSRAVLHVLNVRKISYPARNWTLDFPAHNHP